MPKRFSEGPTECKIAFIGEAPAKNELVHGRPFVGYDGKQLTELLHARGIVRAECFITNVIHEYVPPNSISKWLTMRGGKASPSEKFLQYSDELMEELSKIKANVLVPLGNAALYAVTGEVGITKYRGSIMSARWNPDQKVIPTIHPGAIRENYLSIHSIRHDLGRIKVESQFPEIKLTERELLIRPSLPEALAFLEECKSSSEVGVDIEVVNEEVSCIALATTPNRVMCIPFHSRDGDYFYLEDEVKIWRELAAILEDENIMKIGQNFVFDADFMFRKYNIRSYPVMDTMIAMGIAFPELPKALYYIASLYTREPYYKDDMKKWASMGSGGDETFWKYNCRDSAVTIEAMPYLLNDLKKQGNLETFTHQNSLVQPLLYMMGRGMKVNIEDLARVREEVKVEIIELAKTLEDDVGHPINHRSPKQLAELFYKERRHKPYTKRGGGVTTDEKALKRLARKGDSAAKLLLQLRKKEKMVSSYLNVKLDDDNRIRSSMNPVGTKNGRFSSSKSIFDTGLNVQTLPEIMKKLVVADTGYLIGNTDLSQAENRILAYIAPELSMIDAFESGKDVHSLTGAMICGKTPEEVKSEHKENIMAPIGGGDKTWRFWGKKANHSLNYDEGYKEFALINEIPEKDARFIVDRYHQIYPGVRRYHEWVRQSLTSGRTVENPFGRRRIFLNRWGRDLFKDAYAYIPQSTVAYIINEWGVMHIWKDQEKFGKVELLNQVHDSVVYQIPLYMGLEYIAKCIHSLHKSLTKPIRWRARSFSIPVDTNIGLNLASKLEISGESYEELLDSLKENYSKLTT